MIEFITKGQMIFLTEMMVNTIKNSIHILHPVHLIFVVSVNSMELISKQP